MPGLTAGQRRSQCLLCILHSARWHVEEACRQGRSSVWSRGNPLPAAPSILNHWCHRPAIPTSVHNLTRKVPSPCYHWVKERQVWTKRSRANKLSFFILPQTWPVGITSTGATWFLSMEFATTSSTASSAASPAQTQTYNLSPSPQKISTLGCLCLLLVRGERWHCDGSVSTSQCHFFSPGCRTSGYEKPMLTALRRNVIRTIRLKEKIMRRNSQNGDLD